MLKEKMETAVREHMGESAVVDCMSVPRWKAGLHAERERSACKVH